MASFSYLTIQGVPNRMKQGGKYLIGNGEKEQRRRMEIEGNWRDETEVIRKLRIGRLLWKALKFSYPHLRSYEFFFLT